MHTKRWYKDLKMKLQKKKDKYHLASLQQNNIQYDKPFDEP